MELTMFEGMSESQIRGFIAELERTLSESSLHVDVPIVHHFSKSVYAREMRLEPGSLIVGKIHRHANLNILSEGEVSVLTEDGGVIRAKAPYTFVARPGSKRVIFAHTKVTWTTIHGTDLTDLSKIEEEFIAPTFDDVLELKTSKGANLCLG